MTGGVWGYSHRFCVYFSLGISRWWCRPSAVSSAGQCTPPQSVSVETCRHLVEVTDKFFLFGQHCWLHWLLQYWYPSTTRTGIFSDGPVRPSLAPESAESRHQAENLHYVCPGSRPLWCWNLDAVKGRLTKATCIPHDMPKGGVS